jgi:AcrR family transcriptional regulator
MAPRPGLDKRLVVQAAADLVNHEGLQALTLSSLARHLGVRTPSLYNHVDGLPDLYRELALMNTRQLGEQLGNAVIGKSGPQALAAIAQAYRAYIKEFPGLYLASLRASGNQEPVDLELQAAEARVVEVALAVVASFGLKDKDGLHAVRGLRSMVHGFATLEAAGGFGLPLDCDESFRRLVDILIHGLQQMAEENTDGS